MSASSGSMAPHVPRRGLYAITPAEGADPARLAAAVRLAIRGGAVMIQYRAKRAASTERARMLREICLDAGVPFIVNDDPRLARDIGADGVHLGRDDPPLAEARTCLGGTAIIGVSCYDDLARAEAAASAGADYVAFGSFFRSRSKPQAVRAPMELLRTARQLLRLPIVAIGGITPENGASLLAAGADLLAVIDGVFKRADPEAAARRYSALFE
ncbi:MAG: thiamine phosphate synthase [Chromatiales bacterium]